MCICMCMCMYACQHPSLPPPGGPSLKIGPQSKKEKTIFLLSCLPTISVMISTIASRKERLERLSLFPGPLWTTIYIYIQRVIIRLCTRNDPPRPFRPLGHGVDANTKFNTRRTNNTGLGRRKKGKRERKEKRRKKKIQNTAFLFCNFNFRGCVFSCIFRISFLLFKFFVKKT